MSSSTSPIIAVRPARTRVLSEPWLPIACGLGVLAWGIAAALAYYAQGLTLSHYDAKGHLVVARRVIDSITPGWQQVGAVWLPLPHLLNMLPVQVDAFYRTGASGVAMSIVSLALGAWATARLVLRSTGSAIAAVTGAVLLALNPNLLYLQSTPMTEPLLIGLLMLAAMALQAWVVEGSRAWRRASGWLIAAACMTRYEAWPFTAAALSLATVARVRRGEGAWTTLRDAAAIAVYPAVAIVLFLVNSRVTVGAWFVTGGFYVPDPLLQGDVVAVTGAIWWGARQLGSDVLLHAALVAAALVLARGLLRREHAPALVALALFAVAALPWYAFVQGHPFRIRYMVPVVSASIVAVALGIGALPRRAQAVVAALLLAGVLYQARPFDDRAAMVQEAQWDRPNSAARAAVTACLAGARPGETIMASMGSLAHYMQELSHAGFGIRDFLHEGNGDIWLSALGHPARYVPWLLIEERAEGGDMLAARAAKDPGFLAGMTRVCEGGGVALYRRR